jgi:hypothetical protein
VEVREGDHIVAHRLGEPEHVVRVVHAHDDPAPEATT